MLRQGYNSAEFSLTKLPISKKVEVTSGYDNVLVFNIHNFDYQVFLSNMKNLHTAV